MVMGFCGYISTFFLQNKWFSQLLQRVAGRLIDRENNEQVSALDFAISFFSPSNSPSWLGEKKKKKLASPFLASDPPSLG